MRMNCPRCESTDVTRAAVEWAKGTTVAVRGAGKPNARRVGNLQQNLSAFKLAPPDKPKARLGIMLVMIVLGFFVAGRVPDPQNALRGALFIAAVIAPFAWGVWEIGKRNERYDIAVRHWETLWYCNRCGEFAEEHHFAPRPVGAGSMQVERGVAAAVISQNP
jgi:ribosomal protein L37AE/L43A